MNIEALKEKVSKAQEKVEKIEKTIERYNIQKEKKIKEVKAILEKYNRTEKYEDIKDIPNARYMFYDVNKELHYDFYYGLGEVEDKESSIESNKKKLEEAKEALKLWKERLGAEEARIQYIQDSVPDIIKEFLENWKNEVIKYYINKSKSYPEDLKEYKKEKHRLYYNILKETVDRLVVENREEFLDKYCHNDESRFHKIMDQLSYYDENGPQDSYYDNYRNVLYFGYKDQNNPEHDRRYIRLEESWEARYGDGFFQAWKSERFDLNWLNIRIEEEKKNKLLDLMNRVTKVTGTITDASNLHLENGDINGIIIGERGKAKVQTISAGGYNEHVILDSGRRGQCFHYRVLINPIKYE